MGEKNFPAILWEMISQENLAIKWDKSGKRIIIDFEELDKYLQSSESILPMKNQVDFVLQLFNWGFRRSSWMNQKQEKKFLEIYFNQFFSKNNPNLLTLINPLNGIRKNGTIFVKKNHFRKLRERDLCCQIVRKFPQRERIFNHLATVVAFGQNKRNFKKQLNMKRALNLSLGSTSWREMEVDSTEDVEKTINVGEMAGSYGLENMEKLRNFLGPYIPIYALQNSDTFPPNFAPQATSSHIWDTPILEDSSVEVVPVNENESKTDGLTLSTDEILPEDDQLLDNAMIQTNPDHHEVSLQLQESFDVLYNC